MANSHLWLQKCGLLSNIGYELMLMQWMRSLEIILNIGILVYMYLSRISTRRYKYCYHLIITIQTVKCLGILTLAISDRGLDMGKRWMFNHKTIRQVKFPLQPVRYWINDCALMHLQNLFKTESVVPCIEAFPCCLGVFY